MDATDKVVLAGAVIGVGALIVAFRNSSKKENQSSMSGSVVKLRPTAPVSPAQTLTAIQYLNAEGGAAAGGAAAGGGAATGGGAAAGGGAAVSTPTVGTASSTPVVTTPPTSGGGTPPATPPAHGGGGHGHHPHPHHRRRAPYIIYGSPYWWGNPYAWNWGLWNPYGFDKAVYCMNEFGSLTRVRGCKTHETADECCKRKSRRGRIGVVRE